MSKKIDIGLSGDEKPCFTCGVKLAGMQQKIHDLEIALSQATLENRRLQGIERRMHDSRSKLESRKQKPLFGG